MLLENSNCLYYFQCTYSEHIAEIVRKAKSRLDYAKYEPTLMIFKTCQSTLRLFQCVLAAFAEVEKYCFEQKCFQVQSSLYIIFHRHFFLPETPKAKSKSVTTIRSQLKGNGQKISLSTLTSAKKAFIHIETSGKQTSENLMLQPLRNLTSLSHDLTQVRKLVFALFKWRMDEGRATYNTTQEQLIQMN